MSRVAAPAWRGRRGKMEGNGVISRDVSIEYVNVARPADVRKSRLCGMGLSWILPGLVMLLVLSLSATLRAQTGQGTISGTVTDPQGALVQRADVEVVDKETGVVERTRTNKAGIYIILSLNPGTYTVSVTKEGFEQVVTQGVNVSTAGATTIDVKLPVGKASEVATVTADEDLLSKDTSDVTTTVDHAIVENLPYPERSALEAALLVPGVTGDPLQPGGIATENPNAFTSYVVPGASIAIGGAPPGTSSLVVDGSDVTQASYARAGVSLSNREVQEVTVIVTGISAKYGRTAGGLIVQSSRPGANQYHGGLTYSHTDPFFNAYPIGTQLRSAQHINFYGIYAGGPIWIPKVYDGHNKSFFYVGVEPGRMQNTFGLRGTFQTPDELAGHLHNSVALLNQTALKTKGYAYALTQPRVGGGVFYQTAVDPAGTGLPVGPYTAANKQITGPLSDCGATGVPDNPTATVCPDDVSLALAHNPFAQFVLSNYPTPSNPGPYVKFDSQDGAPQNDGTNASYHRGVTNIDNRYSMRFDHQIGLKDHFFVRYTVTPVSGKRYFAVPADNPLTNVPTDSANTHNIAFGYTRILSNALVNNFHYSFMRVNQRRVAPAATQDYAAKNGLTPASLGYGFPSLGNFNSNGVGYAIQMGIANAAIQVDQNFIAGDDLTLTHGKHLIQFGGDFRWIQSNQYDLSGSTGGKYLFAQAQTNANNAGGLPIATFMLGVVSNYTNTVVTVPGYYRWRYYAGYVQDDWRILPHLTLNIGLRYELELPRQEKFNNQAYLRTDVPGAANGAICFSGACGNSTTLWPVNYKGFEPRFGLAYALSRKTTLRAAYTLSRLPLTGYENVPDPNLQSGATAVNYTSGAMNPGAITDYVNNPVNSASLKSAFTLIGANRGPIVYYANGLSADGLTAVAVNQTNAVPYSQTWSASFQYQPSAKTLIQVTYQGLKGTHLIGPFTNYVNTPSLAKVQQAIAIHSSLGSRAPNVPYGISVTGLQALNPYQAFGDQNIPEIYPRIGSASYNGFYASINQRLGHGLSGLANYAWSKELDNVPDTNTGANSGGFGSAPPQNPFDLSHERSVASFDQPSRLKGGMTYTLQTGKGRAVDFHNSIVNYLLGNITTAGIFTWASGFPSSITLGSTSGSFVSITPVGLNGCTSAKVTYNGNLNTPTQYCASNALPPGYVLRPDIVKGVPIINKNWKTNVFAPTFTPYFNPAAFAIPGSASNPQFGNAPRLLSDARSPREMFLDARFLKAITFKKRYQFNVNAYFGNILNHPVYYGANKAIYSSAGVDLVQGTIKTQADGTTYAPAVNANFGQFNVSQSGGVSRTIRIGAEFNF